MTRVGPVRGETVLTTRRARCRTDGGWVAGRLRLSDRRLAFVPLGGGVRVEVALDAVTRVRTARMPRAACIVETAETRVRLRCFEAAGVARLVEVALRRLPSCDRAASGSGV